MPTLEERVQLLERMVASLMLHQHWVVSPISSKQEDASPPIYLGADGDTFTRHAIETPVFAKGLAYYHQAPWWPAYKDMFGDKHTLSEPS